jgi:sugar phosphate permease
MSLLSQKPMPLQNSTRAWVLWSCAALFYFYQFILRVSPGIMVHELMASFMIDAAGVGALASFYYYSYSALQLPVGVMLDQFGPRRVLTGAVLLCALGGVIFGTASDLVPAQIGRLLIGAGSACAFAGSLKISSLWFDTRKMALATGLTATLGTIGAACGGGPVAALIEILDWRQVMVIFSLLGGGLALIVWVFVRDQKDYPDLHPATEEAEMKIWQGVRVVLRSPQMWILGFYGACLYTPLSALADLWGPSYIQTLLQCSGPEASAISSSIYIGIAVGATLFASFSNWLGLRQFPLLVSALGTAGTIAYTIYGPISSPWMMTNLLFLAGFFCSGHYTCFVCACETMPRKLSGTAVAFVNMITMASGVVFQPLIGWLMDLNWQGGMSEGVRLYTTQEYRGALTAVPMAVFIGIVLALFVKETGPRGKTAWKNVFKGRPQKVQKNKKGQGK